MGLEVTDSAKKRLVQLGFNPAFGARPLKRVIQKEVADRVAIALLDGRFGEGAKILVDTDGEDVVVTGA